MKFYFGKYTQEHEDLGITTDDLLLNNGQYYFYMLEFGGPDDLRFVDCIGRVFPIAEEDAAGLLVAAKVANMYYDGVKENAAVFELNSQLLQKRMSDYVVSQGGVSDVR